jgi:hypothetical protein
MKAVGAIDIPAGVASRGNSRDGRQIQDRILLPVKKNVTAPNDREELASALPRQVRAGESAVLFQEER